MLVADVLVSQHNNRSREPWSRVEIMPENAKLFFRLDD